MTNDHAHDIVVCVEPYADEFTLRPTEKLDVLLSFDSRSELYVPIRPEERGVWIWLERGAHLIDVVKNGQSLWRTA